MKNRLTSERRWIAWGIATGLILLAVGFPVYRWQQERANELEQESNLMIAARTSVYVRTVLRLRDLLANEPDPEKKKTLEQIMEGVKMLAGPDMSKLMP